MRIEMTRAAALNVRVMKLSGHADVFRRLSMIHRKGSRRAKTQVDVIMCGHQKLMQVVVGSTADVGGASPCRLFFFSSFFFFVLAKVHRGRGWPRRPAEGRVKTAADLRPRFHTRLRYLLPAGANDSPPPRLAALLLARLTVSLSFVPPSTTPWLRAQNPWGDPQRPSTEGCGLDARDPPRPEGAGHDAAAQDQAPRERAALRAAAGGQGEVRSLLAPGRPQRERQEGEICDRRRQADLASSS